MTEKITNVRFYNRMTYDKFKDMRNWKVAVWGEYGMVDVFVEGDRNIVVDTAFMFRPNKIDNISVGGYPAIALASVYERDYEYASYVLAEWEYYWDEFSYGWEKSFFEEFIAMNMPNEVIERLPEARKAFIEEENN